MWRKLGCAAIAVLVLGLIAFIVIKQGKDKEGGGGFSFGAKKAPKKDEKPLYESARYGDLEISVEATGSTEPISDIEIKSEATGRIIEFYVEEGDKLVAGDLICKLDQSNQQLAVDQRRIAVKQAELALSQARESQTEASRSNLAETLKRAETSVVGAEQGLADAQASYSRVADMHGKGYATEQELQDAQSRVDNAQTALEQAKAGRENAAKQLEVFDGKGNKSSIEQARLQVESARVALREAEKQLGDSVIKSPIDGIVLEKMLDIGDSVQSVNGFSGGDSILKVADLSKIQVRTSVDEIDIGKIKKGQIARVVVDAYQDKPFEGSVTNVYPQGVASGQGLISFIVIVQVDNAEGLLKGNMTCAVAIQASKVEHQLLIPLAGTRAGKEKDSTIVFVLQEGEDPYDKKAKSDERTVKLGETDFTDVVVLDGLKEGEQIKVRGFETAINFE